MRKMVKIRRFFKVVFIKTCKDLLIFAGFMFVGTVVWNFVSVKDLKAGEWVSIVLAIAMVGIAMWVMGWRKEFIETRKNREGKK